MAGGELVALLGRRGSGKSTLLRVLAGLDPDIRGELTVPGGVAVASQEPRLVPWKRVLANVTLGLRVGRPHEGGRAVPATGLPVSIMDKAAKDDVEVPVPITSKVVGAEQRLVDDFYKAGLTPKSYSFSQCSYNGFNSLFGS